MAQAGADVEGNGRRRGGAAEQERRGMGVLGCLGSVGMSGEGQGSGGEGEAEGGRLRAGGRRPAQEPAGDQPKNWRPTDPRIDGRPLLGLSRSTLFIPGDQPENRRATNPRTGGRPTQELMGHHSWSWLAALSSAGATIPRTGGHHPENWQSDCLS